MPVVAPEPRRCEVCGDPIRLNNTYGICTDQGKSECVAARRRKRLGLPEPGQKTCEICGKPLRLDNQIGVCSTRGNTECLRVRQRIGRGVADPKGHRQLIVIKPGDTFGAWTALEEYDPKRKVVLCRCKDGTEREVRATHLTDGESRSCGCARYENRPPYLKAGEVFGFLTVLKDVASSKDRALVRCGCERGTEKTILAPSVKLGITKSCGCLTETLGGFSKHPLWMTWHSMVQRCENPNHHGYDASYGGREDAEITVCERWRSDPWAFAEDIYREIGPRPKGRDEKGRVLFEFDRVDNDRGYWCGRCDYCSGRGQFTINVQWSDRKMQRANQRTIVELTHERAVLAARVAELEALLAD